MKAPNRARASNGLDPDAEAAHIGDAIAAGTRCAFCGCLLDGAVAEQIGARWYHAEACTAEARKSAPQPVPPTQPRRRRSRITGADTTPDTVKLPESGKGQA
jgi:hypothetical protein